MLGIIHSHYNAYLFHRNGKSRTRCGEQSKAKELKEEHKQEAEMEELKQQMQVQREDMERKIIQLKSLRNIEKDKAARETYQAYVSLIPHA